MVCNTRMRERAYSETTLIALDDAGRGQPGLVVPGWIVTI
jgi:hypothetical protein